MKNRSRAIIALLVCAFMIIPSLLSLSGRADALDLAGAEQRQYYKNGASPMSGEPKNVTFKTADVPDIGDGAYTLSLDGVWRMTDKGTATALAKGEGWDGAIDADVPGSIHTALFKAGVIDDPYKGENMKTANKYGEKNWYLLRSFEYSGSGKNVLLSFEGVCNVADFYLNGVKIGSHEGMFGGPYIDVTDSIRQGENTLMVHLKPAKDYTRTVVFNCSYGWHYAKLFPLGIWQSVSVSDRADAELDHPFITTTDCKNGTVDLAVSFNTNGGRAKGRLTVKVSPKNFNGTSAYFTDEINVSDGEILRYRADVPDAHLWWPNGYGAQDLYELEVLFEGDGGSSYSSSEFGIRQLDYAPLPQGENAGAYNRQFVINGVKVFMKGAGWCTIDSMMRFSREDYDRILSRAHDAGINYFRAWGGGLVETDEFYDLCDEYGICVYQEWPCCWDSTNTQPADVLYETVVLGAKRLRNRPSLVVWGGGNEGNAPYTDKVLNNMGKLTYETDGTRDFWRQDGGTGGMNIVHDHIWWSGASPEHYIKTYTNLNNTNMSEYGLGAMMNRSSIEKFASENELAEWPIGAKNSIAYHTATFNGFYGWNPTPYGYDIDTHLHYAAYFTDVSDLDEMILGSQLSQAQSDYPLAINARIKAPQSSVNVIYKLNDNYPGASWSIVDWYGAPKAAYYLMQDAYRPVMAAFKADRYNTVDRVTGASPLSLPVFILDDTVSLAGKKTSVTVTAYDEELRIVKSETFDGKTGSSVNSVGSFELTAEQTDHTPLIITADLLIDGAFYNRTYMYFNYESDQGCLFYLPRTTLEYSVDGNTVNVKNTGDVPAIGVTLKSREEDKFVCSDNYFMLTPGQSEQITVNDASLFEGVDCFNPSSPADRTAPTAPSDVTVSDVTFGSAVIGWGASTDDVGLFGYLVTLKDASGAERTVKVHKNMTSVKIGGLEELTGYTVTVTASDNNSNVSAASGSASFTTLPDLSVPAVRGADLTDDGRIRVTFSTAMEKESAEDTAHYILNNGAKITSAESSSDGKTVLLTVPELDSEKTYTLGVIGITDTKKSANRVDYTEFPVVRGLYLMTDFEPDGNGLVYTGGKYSAAVTGVNGDATYIDSISGGKALSASSGYGAQVGNVSFSLPENSSVVMDISGRATEGFNVLIAKGPKTSGHFEFYTRSGELYIYAPDIGDIDLGYNINKSGEPRTLAFVRTDGKLNIYDSAELVASVALRGRIAEKTDTLSFGVLNDGSLPFGGTIDRVCVYERALLPAELETGKTVSVAGPEPGGDDNGKKIKTTDNFNDGTAVNLWFRQSTAKDDFVILFAKADKSSDKHFEIYTERGALSFYAPKANNGNALSLRSDLNKYVGSWHMLTVIHSDGKLETYIDGAAVSSVPIDWNVEDGEATARFGELVEGGFAFPGSITGYTFFDHVPDQEEIGALYAKEIKEPAEQASDGAIGVAAHTLVMNVGETAESIITADGVQITVEAAGDSAVYDNDMISAVKPGETVLRIRSSDGRYVSAILVIVNDPPAPEITDTETDAQTEALTDPAVTEKTDDGKKTSPAVPIVIACAAAAAVGAAIAVIIRRRKK